MTPWGRATSSSLTGGPSIPATTTGIDFSEEGRSPMGTIFLCGRGSGCWVGRVSECLDDFLVDLVPHPKQCMTSSEACL